MVVMIATEEFRQRQLRELPRAATISHQVSDPARAQRNRLARDRIVAEDAARSARRHGICVIEIDETRDADAIAGHRGRPLTAIYPAPRHPAADDQHRVSDSSDIRLRHFT